MRGSPLLHLLLLAAAFVLLSVPLRHLTGAQSKTASAAPAAGVVAGVAYHPVCVHSHLVHVRIQVLPAHAPQSLALLSGGKNLLAGADASRSPVECEAELELGHEGNELILEAQWSDGTPDTAVTVELEPAGLETRAETRWSEGGSISDVLTFIW